MSDVSGETPDSMSDEKHEEMAERIETELDADRRFTKQVYYSYATVVLPVFVGFSLFALNMPLYGAVVLLFGSWWVLTAIAQSKS